MADRRHFFASKRAPRTTVNPTGKDAVKRKMSRFDWPLNIPVAPPPQRVSYKQRLGWMRQGVVGGRFLHTISSGKTLWKTRTIPDFMTCAIAWRNAKELLRLKRQRLETDSIQTGAARYQCFRIQAGTTAIHAWRSSIGAN